MTDEDANAAFDELVGGLDIDEPTDVPDFSSMDSEALSSFFHDVREELLERAEMRDASTPRGRELHSLRAAALIELRKRGLR